MCAYFGLAAVAVIAARKMPRSSSAASTPTWWPLSANVTIRACGISRFRRAHERRRNGGLSAASTMVTGTYVSEPRLVHMLAATGCEVIEDTPRVLQEPLAALRGRLVKGRSSRRVARDVPHPMLRATTLAAHPPLQMRRRERLDEPRCEAALQVERRVEQDQRRHQAGPLEREIQGDDRAAAVSDKDGGRGTQRIDERDRVLPVRPPVAR
jgi:hypothetical protein